jgi:hypothetical protein
MIGSPRVVAALCLPLCEEATAEVVDAWLAELAGVALIQLYEVGDLRLLQLNRWQEEQAGLRRTYPSRWSAPPGWSDWNKGFERTESEPAPPLEDELEIGREPEPKSAGDLRAHDRQVVAAEERTFRGNGPQLENDGLPPLPWGAIDHHRGS